MNQADAQLYRDLARASGGQAIEVTKSDLSVATTVIEDSSAGAVVGQLNNSWLRMVWHSTCINVKPLFLRLSGDSFPGSEESWGSW